MNVPTRFFFLRAILFCLMALWFGAGAVDASKPVSLLDGKLTLELEDGFGHEKDRGIKKVVAGFKAKKGDAWGIVTRGKHGLEPDALGDYLTRKVAEYTKGLFWLPKLVWLKKEMVTINGRLWADLRFIGQLEGAKNPLDGMLYTRILATSYGGQLLEIIFTSNTDRNAKTKTKIDRMIESVKLEE